VKGEAVRFIFSHATRVQSEETRAKLGAAGRGKPRSPEWRRKISLGLGGTGTPTAGSLHQMLRRDHPKTGVCEECGREGPTDYAFKHHPRPHTADRNDYRELCRSCHIYFDRFGYLTASRPSNLPRADIQRECLYQSRSRRKTLETF